MAATAQTSVAPRDELEATTRERILALVAEAGPVSVVELAARLGLTAAGVRRHVAALEDAGKIAVHRAASPSAGRGRPARRYVATDAGQASLSSAYGDLAARALEFLATTGGESAVEAFAAQRAAELVGRHRDAVEQAGADVTGRVRALAAALAGEGYAATARPVLAGQATQLCQGHCPVQGVAARFPQLCEAETRAFSDVLGVHVQRLSTLAAGAHVCTTHVPTAALVRAHTDASAQSDAASDRPAAAGTVEGTR